MTALRLPLAAGEAQTKGAGHALHAVTFALPALALLALWWSLELEVRRNGYPERGGASAPPQSPARTDALAVAAVGSASAAAIHAAVIGAHFNETVAAGVFFVVVTLAQAAWAVWALARPGRLALAAGAVGNLGVVALWVLSRTVGVWTGAGVEVEHVGLLDSVATGLEVVVVACCVGVLWSGGLRRPLRLLTGTLRAPSVGTAVAVVAAVALLVS